MGGPAQHVGLLSGERMAARGYDTLLVHGKLATGEDSMQAFAESEGATLRYLPHLVQPVAPVDDARALWSLSRLIRTMRPDIVHTHTAKAGFVGRLAALTVRPQPVIIHTYHGHVLSGYFGPTKSGLYRRLERAAARVSDSLIGVSQATVDELVKLRIAPAEKFRVIPLGLDLGSFAALDLKRDDGLRRELHVAPDETLLSFVGRMVPIKRLDLTLQAVAEARARGARIRLAVVGDGQLRPALERMARGLGIAEAVAFLGYRRDLTKILASADAAVLSSDNEGTPVSLIEAAAAGRPAIATDVGGVREVVTPETGLVVEAGSATALARGIETLARDAELKSRMGARARAHALARYSAERLITDLDGLYRELLASESRGG